MWMISYIIDSSIAIIIIIIIIIINIKYKCEHNKGENQMTNKKEINFYI